MCWYLYAKVLPILPILIPDRARALSADWAPGPGVLVPVPPVALNLTCNAVIPTSLHLTATSWAANIAAYGEDSSRSALTFIPPVTREMVSRPVRSVTCCRNRSVNRSQYLDGIGIVFIFPSMCIFPYECPMVAFKLLIIRGCLRFILSLYIFSLCSHYTILNVSLISFTILTSLLFVPLTYHKRIIETSKDMCNSKHDLVCVCALCWSFRDSEVSVFLNFCCAFWHFFLCCFCKCGDRPLAGRLVYGGESEWVRWGGEEEGEAWRVVQKWRGARRRG